MAAVRSGDSGDRGASGCEASAGAQIYSSTAECSEGMRRSHDAKTKAPLLRRASSLPPHSLCLWKGNREGEREII